MMSIAIATVIAPPHAHQPRKQQHPILIIVEGVPIRYAAEK
jgi:hypothetical protein